MSPRASADRQNVSSIGTSLNLREPAGVRLANRGFRMAILLSVMIVLSLVDLFMTMTHLANVGMLEANPFARLIMKSGLPWLLVAWKLATVAIGVGILWWARRRFIAEAAAWICCGVLLWLSLQWVVYHRQILALGSDLAAFGECHSEIWVDPH